MIHFKARTLDWKIILRLLAGLKKRIPGKFTLTYFLGIGRKVFDTHSDNQLRHSYMYWKVFSHFYFFRDFFPSAISQILMAVIFQPCFKLFPRSGL